MILYLPLNCAKHNITRRKPNITAQQYNLPQANITEKTTCRNKSFFLAPRVGLEPTALWLTVIRSTDWANREYIWICLSYIIYNCLKGTKYLWNIFRFSFAVKTQNDVVSKNTNTKKEHQKVFFSGKAELKGYFYFIGDILAHARSIYLLRKFDITSFHSVAIWYKFLYLVAARQHIASKIYRVRSTYSKFRQEFISMKKRQISLLKSVFFSGSGEWTWTTDRTGMNRML